MLQYSVYYAAKNPGCQKVIEMKEKQRNHLISEKVPLIAIVFWIILAFVLEIILDGLFKAFFPSDGTGMIGNIPRSVWRSCL